MNMISFRDESCRRSLVGHIAMVLLACLIGFTVAIVQAHPSQLSEENRGLFDRVSLISPTSKSQTDDLTLILNANGFQPAEVTRAAGKFLLSVDNRSGVAQITLRLTRDGMGPVRDIPVPRDATDWAEELDLQAGVYELTEVSHPEWVCRISVQ